MSISRRNLFKMAGGAAVAAAVPLPVIAVDPRAEQFAILAELIQMAPPGLMGSEALLAALSETIDLSAVRDYVEESGFAAYMVRAKGDRIEWTEVTTDAVRADA